MSLISLQEIQPGAKFSFNERHSGFWGQVFLLRSKTQISGCVPREVWTIQFDPIYDQPLESGFVSEISAVVNADIELHLIEGERNDEDN